MPHPVEGGAIVIAIYGRVVEAPNKLGRFRWSRPVPFHFCIHFRSDVKEFGRLEPGGGICGWHEPKFLGTTEVGQKVGPSIRM